MPDLDQIDIDDLYSLQKELGSFLDSYFLSEQLFCEGEGDYNYVRELAEENALKLRSRIKALAIDWGLHGEFLDEYLAAARVRITKMAAA